LYSFLKTIGRSGKIWKWTCWGFTQISSI